MILEHGKLPSAFDRTRTQALRRYSYSIRIFPERFEYDYRFAEYEYERFETRIERVVLHARRSELALSN